MNDEVRGIEQGQLHTGLAGCSLTSMGDLK